MHFQIIIFIIIISKSTFISIQPYLISSCLTPSIFIIRAILYLFWHFSSQLSPPVILIFLSRGIFFLLQLKTNILSLYIHYIPDIHKLDSICSATPHPHSSQHCLLFPSPYHHSLKISNLAKSVYFCLCEVVRDNFLPLNSSPSLRSFPIHLRQSEIILSLHYHYSHHIVNLL